MCLRCRLGKVIRGKMLAFITFSFSFRYFIELFFKLILGIAIEAMFLLMNDSGKRALYYSTKYIIAFGLSILIFLIFSIVLIVIVLKGIWNIRRIQRSRVVTQDLNNR